jgi:hypothetical protein
VSNRREFGRQAKVDMLKRAKDDLGNVRCENAHCRVICTGAFEFHHVDMDAMQIDKTRKLTAADGLVLCIPCHDVETGKQAPILAKVKRNEAKELRVPTVANGPKLKGAPLPTSARALKRRMNPKPPVPNNGSLAQWWKASQ